jgi:hypothetical protein
VARVLLTYLVEAAAVQRRYGYRVVCCPVEGEGHAIPSFAAGGIATFFSQF